MQTHIDTFDRPKELCGIEFTSEKLLNTFLKLNPDFRDTTRVHVGDRLVLLMRCNDYPTRDLHEVYRDDGSLYATFIGPDALQQIYELSDEDF